MRTLSGKIKDNFYYGILSFHLRDISSVLDVGCGENSPLSRVTKTFTSEGIDIFKPSILKSKKRKIHDNYTIGNITKLTKYYKPKSFDTVIALDVVEHLPKKEAFAMMKQMESLARKKVIIMTPNGFYHQDHLDGNPHQEHISSWDAKDFKKKDYQTRGLRGLKYIRGEYASIKLKPWIFWGIIAFFSEPLLYFIPHLSYHLFAFKNLSSSNK